MMLFVYILPICVLWLIFLSFGVNIVSQTVKLVVGIILIVLVLFSLMIK